MPDKKNLPAGARRLIIPASQRLRYRRQAWLSRYAGNLWYPQWPLAAVIIVLAIYDFSRSYPAIHWSELPGHLSILLNFLQSMLAVSLFFSAIGMLFRMRLAWISAVPTTAAKLLLIFFLHTVITPWAWLVINALVFLLLLRSERYFTRRSVMSATIFVAALLSLVLSYSTVGALFLSGGFSPKIHDFISALYFSVVTISTVGYGSIVPKTTEARVFTISVIFLGITVFSTAFSSILVPLIGQHLRAPSKSRDTNDGGGTAGNYRMRFTAC
jgi:voltage-gated potassium channel